MWEVMISARWALRRVLSELLSVLQECRLRKVFGSAAEDSCIYSLSVSDHAQPQRSAFLLFSSSQTPMPHAQAHPMLVWPHQACPGTGSTLPSALPASPCLALALGHRRGDSEVTSEGEETLATGCAGTGEGALQLGWSLTAVSILAAGLL